MQTHTAFSPGIIPNADARRLEFKYDYLGRRVQKTVRAGYNGTVYTTVVTDLRNLYDGWNLIYEFDAAASLAKVRAHVWGLDLSGSLQGAGGVGGLLYTVTYSPTVKVLLPAYDAMGNIHGLADYATGNLTAAYEYDAFGNTVRESGADAALNPIRFSTKYTDLETGLVYYGLRYYSPSLGRFVNRDPIEEQGGLNLYGFVGNNGVNKWDYLGLDDKDEPVEVEPVVVSAGGLGVGGGGGGAVPIMFDSGVGGGGSFEPFTARTPLPLGLLNTITAPDGTKLIIVSSAGTDANGNPVWNAVPYRDFQVAQAAANFAAATAAVNQSIADLNISAGQIAANFATGLAAGVGAATLIVVTGPIGGVIIFGLAVGTTVETYSDMVNNPENYTQGTVLNFTAGNVGGIVGGVGASLVPGVNAPGSSVRPYGNDPVSAPVPPIAPRNTFPENPNDLLPDLPRTPRGHIEPNIYTRIRPEQHPLEPGETYAPRHHGRHYHVEIRADPNRSWNNPNNVTKIKPPGYVPGEGTGFRPGEKFPGDP